MDSSRADGGFREAALGGDEFTEDGSDERNPREGSGEAGIVREVEGIRDADSGGTEAELEVDEGKGRQLTTVSLAWHLD